MKKRLIDCNSVEEVKERFFKETNQQELTFQTAVVNVSQSIDLVTSEDVAVIFLQVNKNPAFLEWLLALRPDLENEINRIKEYNQQEG